MLEAGRLLFLENRAIVDMMVGVEGVGGRGVVVCTTRVVWRVINQEKEADRQGRSRSNVRQVKRMIWTVRVRSGYKKKSG